MSGAARAGLVVALLVPPGVFLASAAEFRSANSVSHDETFYLTAGKAIFARNDFDPCAQYGVAPLPVLLEYSPAILTRGDQVSDKVWGSTPEDPASVDLARATTALVVGVPLLVFVALWAFRQTGSVVAAGATGFLVALSPMVSAHASVATTDVCFTLLFLAALLAIGAHAACPTAWRFLLAGGLVGLALSAKYTGLVLLPVGYLVGVIADFRCSLPIPARLARLVMVHPARQLGLAVVAVLVAWAITGFEVSPVPISAQPASAVPAGTGIRSVLGDGSVADLAINLGHRLHLPSPIVGAYRQYAMAAERTSPTYPTQLFGQVYPTGHRLYYVWAIILKSTPAELVLFVVAGIGVVASCRYGLSRVGRSWVPVVVGVGTLLVLFSFSTKQFGLRYLLPIYPTVVVIAVTGLHTQLGHRPAVFAVTLTGLIGWQAVSAIAASPYSLSYVNEIAGGPGHGQESLGNSDVDWGQGLIALGEFLDREGESAVLVRVLGTTPPVAYGVHVLPWQSYPASPCRYIAVGATMLHRNPALDPRVWPFRGLVPVAVVGGSILVFDTSDPAVWQAYLCGNERHRALASRATEPR